MRATLRTLCIALFFVSFVCVRLNSETSDSEKTKEIIKARETWLRETRETLEKADTFTLFSLDPEKSSQQKSNDGFRGYEPLGKVQIPPGTDRTNLVTALCDGIANGSAVARCFNPRHGIRVVQGSNTIDLVICFECKQIYAYSNKGTNQMLATTDEPTAVFNQTLQKAGIPISKRRTRESGPSLFE